jgi:hypothetical protein
MLGRNPGGDVGLLIPPKETLMDPKPWFKSKVVWFNVLVSLAAVLPLVADLVKQQAVKPEDIILLGVGVINVVLRIWFVSEPVA